nr:MAG TPA: hypothetical protein [Caudoviricetes sp.]DAQ36985.1 MAG TPA: hypothetical protein [Caudoviricetes sp.]DAS43737.1 MAG TPA: hypothetical protein [Caudoviricetes sp.]
MGTHSHEDSYKCRGFCLLDSKDRLAGCLGLLETFTKRAFYC